MILSLGKKKIKENRMCKIYCFVSFQNKIDYFNKIYKWYWKKSENMREVE